MRLVLALALVAGCSKNRVKECEELVHACEKIQSCATLPESSRESLKSAVKSAKDALEMIEDAGDRVSKEHLESVGRICQRQNDMLRRLYEKSAPECLE